VEDVLFSGGVIIQKQKLLNDINSLLKEQYSIKDRPHWFKNETKYYNYFLPIFCNILKQQINNLQNNLYPSNYWKLIMFFHAAYDRDKTFGDIDDIILKLFQYSKKKNKKIFFINTKTNKFKIVPNLNNYIYNVPTYLKAQIFGLSEMLFFRNHDFVYNIHGPYKIDNFFVLVSEFNLFAIPEHISKKTILNIETDIPLRFSICSIYSELEVEIDIFNNITIKKAKHIKDICDINFMNYNLQRIIVELSKIIKQYTNKDFYLQELDIFWEILNYETNINEKIPVSLKEVDINEIFK
jgi:hypothetical protein